MHISNFINRNNLLIVFIIQSFFYKKKSGIKKGDIIISKSPVKPEIDICKRVQHIEGEIVYGIKIPRNHIWIEGDNKDNSFDSRHHGNHIKKKSLYYKHF